MAVESVQGKSNNSKSQGPESWLSGYSSCRTSLTSLLLLFPPSSAKEDCYHFPTHLWGRAVIVFTNTTQFGSPDCIQTESDRSPTCDPSTPTRGCMGNGGKEPPKAPTSLPHLVGNSKVRPSPTRGKALVRLELLAL